MPTITKLVAALAVLAAGCDLDSGGTLGDDSTPAPASSEMDRPQPADASAPPAEFPCDVRAALETYCAPCHAGTTYTIELKTREALLAPAGDAGTLGQMAAALVMTARMPPPSAARFPTADERVVLLAWIAAGMPAGPCGPLTPPATP